MQPKVAMPFDIDSNLATVRRQWVALLALCDDPRSFEAAAPVVSGWRVAQQVQHVALEVAVIAGAIGDMLRDPGLGAGLAPTHPFAMRVLEQGHFPRGSGKAPEDVVPQAVPARADTRELIESTRTRWNTVTANTKSLSGSVATHPHPILGPFTCSLWLRFIPIHTAHHLKIVREILEANRLIAPYGSDVEFVA